MQMKHTESQTQQEEQLAFQGNQKNVQSLNKTDYLKTVRKN